MFDTKEIEVVAKPIWICNSSYFICPKRKYKCKKNKYYKLKITIEEI